MITLKKHKELYKPQVFLIVLRALLILAIIFSFIGILENIVGLPDMTPGKFFSVLWNQYVGTPLILTLVAIVIFLFGSTYVEAGLYHMYFKRITGDDINDQFMDGATKDFLPFLGGNIVIGFCWFIAILPYVLARAV